MNELLQTQVGRFRIISFFEGLSFIFLVFIAMPLKYKFNLPYFVKFGGTVHGTLFIFFSISLFKTQFENNWSKKKILKLFLLSLIPFGNFYSDIKIIR